MAATWRTVRVFISSTFRDMHAEREELVKRVFPQLRKLCEERGVGWAEVDLRWGVFLSDVEAVQAEQRAVLRCLIKHYGLRVVGLHKATWRSSGRS